MVLPFILETCFQILMGAYSKQNQFLFSVVPISDYSALYVTVRICKTYAIYILPSYIYTVEGELTMSTIC